MHLARIGVIGLFAAAAMLVLGYSLLEVQVARAVLTAASGMHKCTRWPIIGAAHRRPWFPY